VLGIALAAAYPSTAEAPRPPEPVGGTAREPQPKRAH
jgi:hypothetical protein